MSRLLRWLSFGATSRVSRDEARAIAQATCASRGLPWNQPVKVYRHYGDWQVWTAANTRGGNVRVIVDGGSGEVKRVAGPLPR
jgi:hypothetical protein